MNRQFITSVLSSLHAALHAIFVLVSLGTEVGTSFSGRIDSSVSAGIHRPNPQVTRCSPLELSIVKTQRSDSKASETREIVVAFSLMEKLFLSMRAASGEVGWPAGNGSAKEANF